MASGLLIGVIFPTDNIPTGTNDVLPDVINAHNVSKFSSGSPNKVFTATGFLPASYSSGGITVDTWLVMDAATSGDVDLDIAFERNNTTFSVASDSFATAKSVDNTTVPGTAQTIFKITHTFSNSEIDSLAAGEPFRIRYTRDSVNDTASGFMDLLISVLKET